MAEFKFEFTLEVLNLLGRGLYRNFATVVAEAVSNSWDADATEVRITINKDNKTMDILDNGKGMNDEDFQGRFLKIGYSRRDDKDNQSKRKVLGRKGIGKLAMLSISNKVILISKKINQNPIGGVIDNSEIDQKIKTDAKYVLGQLPINLEEVIREPSGTYIKFEGIKDTVNNPELIKKYLAVLFNFSFSSPQERFDISVNGEKIGIENLEELNGNTQFLWSIDIEEVNKKEIENRFPKGIHQKNLVSYEFIVNGKKHKIKGFIASVKRPSHLKIHGTGGMFKAGLHLFVNGRLRQEDIFKDIASQRVVESYLYGEIHVDSFDEGNDIFTSNREGVIKDSDEYIAFLDKLKEIQKIVLDDWDKWRTEENKRELDRDKDIDFRNLRSEKRKAIRKFLKHKEDDDLKNVFTQEFMKEIIPEPTGKKILICHVRENKFLADKVYKSLVDDYGFPSKEIIYTSSDNEASRLPVQTNIFEYLRKFFVQDWRDNPHVIFIVSKDMEKSWHASLEAGASWVTQTKHNLFVAEGHVPKRPLNTDDYLYVGFDAKGEYSDKQTAAGIFSALKKQYQDGTNQ